MKKNDHLIKYIKDQISVSSIVSERVKLKKNGVIFRALCPFHKEKTPSFIVDDARQTYHCFGCGAHGDIFTFREHVTGRSFRDNLQEFCRQLGLDLPNKTSIIDHNKEKLEIIEEATKFFEKQLKENLRAQQYLSSRSIKHQIAQKFRLGFATGNLSQQLGKEFLKEQLLELGLISQKDDRIYDYFRERLIFPIIERDVIGFGGRTLANDKLKYLNSRESDFFQKSKVLYGLNFIPNNIEQIIVVEGYLDVLSMHQIGFTNTVAIMGTAFSETQLQKLQQRAKKIYLFFDNDVAGKNAIEKIVFSIILPNLTVDSQIYIINWQEEAAQDPHELSLQGSKVQTLLEKAEPLSEYLWNLLHAKHVGNHPEIISALELTIKNTVSTIKNDLLRKNYLIFLQKKVREIKYGRKKYEKQLTKFFTNININEMIIMKILICYPNLAEHIFMEEIEPKIILEAQRLTEKNRKDILVNKILPDISSQEEALEILMKISRKT